jgi:hypothetical protein
MSCVSKFAEEIAVARRSATTQEGPRETPALRDDRQVQLSVRVPERLRSSVTSTAKAQGLNVTTFVEQALQRAVTEANESFAGLAAELARNIRSELRSAVEDGAYREAAADVERQEARW